MKTLYTKDGVISKLWEQIRPLFSDAVQPTQKHLFDLLLAVLALDGFQSIKFCFEHFIQNISDFHLKSYYMVIPFEQLYENQAWQTPVDQTGHHQNYGG